MARRGECGRRWTFGSGWEYELRIDRADCYGFSVQRGVLQVNRHAPTRLGSRIRQESRPKAGPCRFALVLGAEGTEGVVSKCMEVCDPSSWRKGDASVCCTQGGRAVACFAVDKMVADDDDTSRRYQLAIPVYDDDDDDEETRQ
jgi:hypothetical protein